MNKFYVFIACTLMCQLSDFETLGQYPGSGQIPLNPSVIPQFIDPLPHFAGNRVDASSGNLVIRYEPTQQIAVSTGTVLATGTVGAANPSVGMGNYWGYSVSNDGTNFTPAHWPSFTIVAHRGTPVNVKYENNLDGETYQNVNLVVDQTLNWANPLMDMSMPMTPYIGPVPVAPHLHGGEVASESDGGPNSWFTPGYEFTGESWEEGVDENYYYPNTQEEATIWYHDHGMGVTRLNVYAGLAGFYLLKGQQEEADKLPGWSGDDLVQEVAPVGKSGIFNPKPYLPEIEIAIQDRMFDNTGALYYPNLPTNPMVHPYWTPEFIGDIITVNGKTWPYLSVAPRKYRFHLLNGSNARFYEMDLKGTISGKAGPIITQIGTDGGLLDNPVTISGKLLLAPGERADIVIDFSKSAPGSLWTLQNSAKIPYPNGTSPNVFTVGRLMQFVVNGKMVSATDPLLPGSDKSLVPSSLRATPLVKLTNFSGTTSETPTKVRQLTVNEVMGMGGPLEVLVNNTKFDANGMMTPGYDESEMPEEGTTEVWQIINTTADAHPMHLHLVQFQLVSRQIFNLSKYMKVYNSAFTGGMYQPSVGPPLAYNTPNADGAIGGNPAIKPFLQGKIIPANPNEKGWKDTYIVYPGQVTTFVIRFAPTDIPLGTARENLLFAFDPSEGPGYVWHCHIIDHEDNEMMRPYKILASSFRASSPMANILKNAKISENERSVYGKLDAVNEFSLAQNFPNPFSSQSEIQFRLPESMRVRLCIINQLGKTVKVILDEVAPAGNNTVMINASDLSKGIYFYQLNAGSYSETKKLIIN